MKKILIQIAAFFLVIACIFIFTGKSDGWTAPAEEETTGDILLSGQMYSGKVVVNVTLHPDGTLEHEGNGEKTEGTWEKASDGKNLVAHITVKENTCDMEVVDNGSGYTAEYPPVAGMTLTGKKPMKDIILSGEKYNGKVVVKITLHSDGTGEHEGNGETTPATWENGTGDAAMIVHFTVKGADYDINVIDNGTNYVADYPLVGDMQLSGSKNGAAQAPEVETEAKEEQPEEKAEPAATDAQPAAAASAENEYPPQTLLLNYVADVNPQLTGTFSSPYSVWSEAFGTNGTYLPTESGDVILTWESTGKSKLMEFAADGTYKFSFTTMSVSENGKWEWKDNVLTVTTESGNVFTGEISK